MNPRGFLSLTAALLLAGGCTTSLPDPVGQWLREAEEPAMELHGTELLEFRQDSTFTVINNMIFSHEDSLLKCYAKLLITTDGSWCRTRSGGILLKYDTATVNVSGDMVDFTITPNAATELPPEIIVRSHNELKQGITEYYRNGYGTITTNGGMLLAAPRIADGQLLAIINGVAVGWTAKADQSD